MMSMGAAGIAGWTAINVTQDAVMHSYQGQSEKASRLKVSSSCDEQGFKQATYAVGSLVMLYQKGGWKLQLRWRGLFRISS